MTAAVLRPVAIPVMHFQATYTLICQSTQYLRDTTFQPVQNLTIIMDYTLPYTCCKYIAVRRRLFNQRQIWRENQYLWLWKLPIKCC